MTDYISRDALSELVGEPIEVFLGRLDLKLPPTVDAEPVRHGYITLKTIYGRDRVRCSVCGYEYARMDGDIHNYCPNCGARMEEYELERKRTDTETD